MPGELTAEVMALLREGRLAEADIRVGARLDAGDERADVFRAASHVAFAAGDDPAAVAWMDRAVKAPGSTVELRLERAQLLASVGRRGDALDAAIDIARACALPDAWLLAGRLRYEAFQEREAAEAFARALELEPDRVEALRGRAEALFAIEQFDAAHALFDRLAKLPGQAGSVDVVLRIAQCLARIGRPQDALQQLHRLSLAGSTRAQAALIEGQIHEDVGDDTAARAAYGRAMADAPGWPEPVAAALMLDHRAPSSGVIDAARQWVAQPDTPGRERAFLHYALGKAEDAAGRHDEAWAHWERANALRRAQSAAEPDGALDRRVGELMSIYSPDFVDALAAAVERDPRPVLVVGMPRSGTTLVERVLAAHPEAGGVGESTLLPLLHQDVSAAVREGRFDVAQGAALAHRYLDGVSQIAPESAVRIVDKQPYNFMYLGLAAGLLPDARIVWCRRDPRDVAVSIFSENFSPQSRYATDLRDIRALQEAEARLMEHWRNSLRLPVLEVRYETFVEQFETQARRLIDFAGLPWDAACLEFHSAPGAVRTNSRWQVRQPINTRSVGRWRCYRAPLQAAGFDID